MSCSNCSTANGTPRGCQSNGTCGTDSCNKLTVHNWLENMVLPAGQEPFRIAEVRFKNSRKGFYRFSEDLRPSIGEAVVTDVSQSGHDVGRVTLTGELVRFQMKKKKVAMDSDEILSIKRKATSRDLEVWQAARNKEEEVQKRARELALRLNLQMKLSDVEFQGDGKKATFYYTAESRVDFRQLIKDMAKAFGIRIEMRQIGLRFEASRLGGIGSCGRELCCSTWLTDFRSVSTAAARYQQLSLNPQKLSGQCGKLKCCLNFELDAYRSALKDFPRMDTKLKTEKGIALCQKMDIFKGKLWYTYKDDWMQWHELTAEAAQEIIAKNRKGEPVAALEDYSEDPKTEAKAVAFENVVGQDSLNRFDTPKNRNKKRSNSRNRNRNRNRRRSPRAND
ncbi:MAG: regulatory iron-sulfur-containing complex subunit RicT [Flavobacteriaceae bacterium]|jgi:cell fate regulator YaaT (PSP1 superfamily)|nr:regulatory iron-sulfur-containing complex subunit RicT [Flavobacteriaceae bacterium]